MRGALRPRASASPCTQVCSIEPQTGLCIGCGRTLAEIAGWGSMSDRERAEIRARLPERMNLLSSRENKARDPIA